MDSKSKINVISFIVLVGFTTSIVYHYILGNFFKLSYPYNSFLFYPSNIFGDFTASLMQIKLPIPYEGGYGCVYFPFFYVFGKIFVILKLKITLTIFLLVTSLIIFRLNLNTIKVGAIRICDIQQSVILTFMSFPFLFCWDRGNFEILVLLLTYFSLSRYRNKDYYSAVLLLSLAAAIKPFVIFLMVLFIKDRKLKEVFLFLISLILISFLSLLLMRGTVAYNFKLLMNNLSYFQKILPFDLAGLGFNDFGNSIFSMLKFIYLITKNNLVLGMMARYYVLVVILFTIVTSCLLVFVKDLWKKTFLIFAMMCLLPYISPDYRLIYFIIPLHFFIQAPPTTKKMDNLFSILFSLIFIPKNYFCYLTRTGYNGVLFDPLIILILSVLIIGQDFKGYQRANKLKIKSGIEGK